MDVTLLYFDDCPNWKIADQRLAAIAAGRADVTVTRHRVETIEEAERLGFHGSPSILVDGVDVFAEPGAGVGLSIVSDDEVDESSSDFGVNLFGGAMFPAGGNHLFAEARYTLSEVNQASLALGITFDTH